MILRTDDHRKVLDTINDRGITRLAVPDRPPRQVVHRPKEVEAALDRIASAFLYDASGRVAMSRSRAPTSAPSSTRRRRFARFRKSWRCAARPAPCPAAASRSRKMTTIMRAGWSPEMKRSPPKTAGGVRGAAEPALGRGACDRDLSPDPGRRGAGTPCIRRTAPECHRGGMKAGLPLQLRRIASRTACTALSLRLSGSIHAVIDRRYAVYALSIRRLTMRLQL